MKNNIILLAILVFFIQCEKPLEENPIDFLSETNFYSTEADAEAAIAATYSSLGGGNFYTIWYMALLEISSDYMDGRGSQFNISQYQGLDGQNQSRAFGCFSEIYAGINRANVVIQKVEKIDMNEKKKRQIIAEAYFLRAFFYTHLVKNWAGVPLILEEVSDLNNVAVPRSSLEEIYNAIIADLNVAIPDLPDSYPANLSGRVSSWAAKMLLADVYLTNENWEMARDIADDVINNGGFNLVEVNESDDFLEIYGPDVITHSEDIFSIHHSETNGNAAPQFMHRPGEFGIYATGGYWGWIPNLNSFIGNWDDNDLRKDFNLYTEIIVDGEVIPLPDSSPILFRKYRDGEAICGTCNRNNIPVYRLPEAYLIYAEASNEIEGAPSSLALERLNIIKRRAYGYDLNSPSPIDYTSGMDKETFKDSVLLERGYEFLLELKRWHDLKRIGRAKEVIEATGKNFNDISLLFPLPLDEINNNPAISPEDQNPGY